VVALETETKPYEKIGPRLGLLLAREKKDEGKGGDRTEEG